jgi:transposase-like protein
VLERRRPIAQVAEDLDVGSQSLRSWVRQARTDAGVPGAQTSELLEEVRRLRSENRALRKTERAFLSRLTAVGLHQPGRYAAFVLKPIHNIWV